MWGDMGKCGEMWGDMGRCREMWGAIGHLRRSMRCCAFSRPGAGEAAMLSRMASVREMKAAGSCTASCSLLT